MKIALITDTHFGARNDNLEFNEYFYRFYENVFFPYLDEHDIKTVVHLGDCTDRRKFISYRIAKDMRTRFFQPMFDRGLDVHVIIGNHDTFYKNTNEVNSMEELIGSEKMSIYTETTNVEFDGTPICFVPWINSGNYAESVKRIQESQAEIAMGHLEINGFEMHAGHFAENGYDKNIFKGFDVVMSGHFHKKSDDGQVYYLGNPYQITWSDYDCPKGFHIFDTETRELTRVLNPYTIFEKIYYDDTQTDYDTVDVSRYDNKFVKLVVVNKKDLVKFDTFTDRLLNETNALEVKIVEDFSDLDADHVSDEIVQNAEDTLTVLERYIDELDVELDKKRMKGMMKSLYLEASELEL